MIISLGVQFAVWFVLIVGFGMAFQALSGKEEGGQFGALLGHVVGVVCAFNGIPTRWLVETGLR